MNRQDAIKALMRAGKSKEVAEVVDRAAARAGARFKEVRADGSRTDDWKRWALAVASNQVRTGLDAELIRMAEGVVRTDRDDAERVFGTRGLSGDPASLVISRRDAADRVEKIEDRAELRKMLERATRSGDEVLARAVAERAVVMQDATTMNQFIADRPALEAASERLWNAERASNDAFGITMRLVALKPEELSGQSFDSIDDVARSPEPGTAAPASAGWA